MKNLVILSVVFGLGAVGAGLYSKFETHDRYKNEDSKREAEAIRKIPASRRSTIQALTVKIRDNIVSALKIQQIAMWILSILALAIGVLAVVKKHDGKLHFAFVGGKSSEISGQN